MAVDEALLGLHSDTLIDLRNFHAEQVNLEDISHGLAKECRFGLSLGLDVHYSVAQHCVVMANYALDVIGDPEIARLCLMHDASEAYLMDIPSGLKKMLPDYLRLEEEVTQVINDKYNLKYNIRAAVVKTMDTRILVDEVILFLPNHLDTIKRQLWPNHRELGVYLVNEMDIAEGYFKRKFLQLCDKLDIKD